MASSSSSEFESTYDIFLSFRGEDTRKKFTDHLYKALRQEGFHTFRDDDEIPKGKFIKPELRKAIMNSRTSVIVLSKNYAHSTACLFELQMILDRVKTSDHFVLPVFFEVDPQEIKQQALNLQFGGTKVTVEEVKGWSAALKDVARMKGMVWQNQCDGYETKFIEDIVGEIRRMLAGNHPGVTDHQELDKNMKILKRAVVYLCAQEDDINREITSAEDRPQKRLKTEVEVWLNDVQQLKDDVQRLEQEIDGGMNLFSQLWLGKHIIEKIQEVEKLQEKGRSFDDSLVNSDLDIFLSFRGEDTRKKFTDHLYEALKREGFHTFSDDNEIPKGKFIKPELRKAIMNSRMSVIVLSKNYANSTACLFELQLILERRKTSDHFVLPVYFEVDPQEIKQQALNLQFGGTKVTEEEEVKGWSEALKDVARMKGMVSQNQCDGYEAKFIEDIVGEIRRMLAGNHPGDRKRSMGSFLTLDETPDPKSREEKDRERLKLQVDHYPDAIMSISDSESASCKVPPTMSHHFSILHVLDLSYTEIKSLPQSISRLVALQKLILRSCELLMELPPEIGELRTLEVLDLEGTEILCLPKEIAKLVNLTCLKVSFYGYASQTVQTVIPKDGYPSQTVQTVIPKDGYPSQTVQTVIPKGVLSNLKRLIELIIDVTPYGNWWDEVVKDIIHDLRSLNVLTTLKLYLPTAELLEEVTSIFPGLAYFRFTVGPYEEHFISRLPRDVEEEFNNREKLEKGLKYVDGDRMPNEITKVFKLVDAFYLQRHWTAKSLTEFGHENINEVKFCLVMECNEFRTIIDSEQFYQGKDAIVLGSLERLIIRYLKNVESIWKGPVGEGSLSNLKSLVMFTCPNLTTLLTIDMLRNLSNLEELIVEDCPKIESLISCPKIDSLISLKSSGSKSDPFLPSLKKISLIDLPELVSISGGLWIAPKLERMLILYCSKIEKLSTTEVSSTELKVIEGEKEWWDALKWYESDLSTKHEDYLTSLFIPLRRDGDLMAQLTED